MLADRFFPCNSGKPARLCLFGHSLTLFSNSATRRYCDNAPHRNVVKVHIAIKNRDIAAKTVLILECYNIVNIKSLINQQTIIYKYFSQL